jgi:hypothetical protein
MLIEAMGWALEALTASDARSFYSTVATEHRANCYDRRFKISVRRADRL